MICCENITNLGCFDKCEAAFDLGIVATATGLYTLHLEHNGVIKKYAVQTFAGSPIMFPNIFNENKISHFTITQPNGVELPNCFKINIK